MLTEKPRFYFIRPIDKNHLAHKARLLLFLSMWLAGLFLGLPGFAAGQSGEQAVYVLEINGVINPPAADYIDRVLSNAADDNSALAVITLDTPGGLDTSMRKIVQGILNSPVPVAVYVSPSGARAASAGLFILQAAHIAAMAPGTNTGAAHPVSLGGEEVDETAVAKIENDAAALIRSLAGERGRNVDWVERAVRESVSVTAEEALDMNVVEIIAADLEALLEQVDGLVVETPAGEATLEVSGLPIREAPMSFTERTLHVISDPNIAFILLSVGSLGLMAELFNPGALVPGILGVIALIMAFYALGNLPTNWAGVALIVLAILLFIGEISAEGIGFLGFAAVIALVLGGLILFRPLRPVSPAMPSLYVNPVVLGGVTLSMAAFIIVVVAQLIRARRMPVSTGPEHYLGQTARVERDLNPRGKVWFDGQAWNAELQNGGEQLAGQQVRVVGLNGLTLLVEPLIDVGDGKETSSPLDDVSDMQI